MTRKLFISALTCALVGFTGCSDSGSNTTGNTDTDDTESGSSTGDVSASDSATDSDSNATDSDTDPTESDTDPTESDSDPTESDSDPTESDSDPTESDTDPTDSDSDSDGSTGTSTSTTGSASDSDSETGIFIETGSDTDVPLPEECDIFDQDTCPEGSKCVGYDSQGGTSWDKTKCVPVVEDPGQATDECQYNPIAEGGDTCDKGLFCYPGGDVPMGGKCLDVCTGTPDDPICGPQTICSISNDNALVFCIPTCDPLSEGSCDQPTFPGDICIPSDDGFFCIFPGVDPLVPVGEPCEYGNVCVYGAACYEAANTNCNQGSPYCCADMCDLTEPNTCTGDLECLPVYEPPLMGFEDIGGCFVPE